MLIPFCLKFRIGGQSPPVGKVPAEVMTVPTYEYACAGCEIQFEKFLPMSQSDEPQLCPDCGVQGKRIISMPNFILKGDDWVGKNLKIKGQMEAKNRILSKRQEERKREAPGVALAPNVDGERVGSWAEAQKLAASKGKNVESYAQKVQAESKKG